MRRTNAGRVAAVIAAVVAVACAGAPAVARAGAPQLSLTWQAPTPVDGTTFNVVPGQPVTIDAAASDANAVEAVHVTAAPLPPNAKLTSTDGNPASARLTWIPTSTQTGDFAIVFGAKSDGVPPLFAPPRTFFVHVEAPAVPTTPFPLSDAGGLSRWAYVVQPAVVRAAPTPTARRITTLATYTREEEPNLTLLLTGFVDSRNRYWVRVRLPILPNNSTGWVQRDTLGAFHENWTHLVVNRSLFTATLYRRGRAIFRTRVGVGRSYWPTPAGEFYVRERLTGFNDPFYGPVAFGTSARSSVLTDWPGGGFIGIHGTNEPQILPGAVSHGCIRLANAQILRLARLMPLGTPLTVA